MRKQLLTPATNERGPRYMEKALAAIHTSTSSVQSQANREHQSITLEYSTHEGRVGLSLRFPEITEELVTGPIIANYPNCSITKIDEEESCPAGLEPWSAELELVPELFPILRHAQFEDLLNHNFADPVSGILRAIKSDEHLTCRIEIIVTPATPSRTHRGVNCVKRLDREFFRHHHRLARYYARHITGPHGWLLAWLLGLIALTSAEPPRTPLDTSTSRLHEREDDLQAASDKIGGHLFETHIRLSVSAPSDRHSEATRRIRQMAGAFGAFTKSRLATFRFLSEPRDVLFIGPPGTGKSFLVQAIGYEAINQGRLVLYRSIFDVVRSKTSQTADRLRGKISTRPALRENHQATIRRHQIRRQVSRDYRTNSRNRTGWF